MKKTNLKEFISQSHYTTKYLPIIKLKSEKIYAYEALSHFTIKDKEVSSEEFFKKLHNNDKLFFLLERKNKSHQINNSDQTRKLVLHFDIAVFSQKEYRKYWKEFLAPYKEQIIIDISYNDIITNEEIDAQRNMVKWLHKHDFKYMLSVFYDDLNIISFEYLEKATYVKFHKKILKKVAKNRSYEALLQSIILFCQKNKTKTVMKRVDGDDELKRLKCLGFDYVQGSIFS